MTFYWTPGVKKRLILTDKLMIFFKVFQCDTKLCDQVMIQKHCKARKTMKTLPQPMNFG